ncbi:MAG: cytidylate kinase family protein [Chitinophagales bacterium]|nr:cytidylate kinase family protein [Chitinophagales bacterium]
MGKLLAEKLSYAYLSMGDYSREYAKEKFNADINAFQAICKQRPEIDRQLDESFIEKCRRAERAVIDYRLGFHFVKNAFHVFLKVSDETASKRIALSGRENENAESIRKRNSAMRERFMKVYGADFTDLRNYQFVVDTDNLNPAEIVIQILDKL